MPEKLEMAEMIIDDQSIFEIARKISARDARQAYLRQACGTDAALEQRIEALLNAYEKSETFLETPPQSLFAATDIVPSLAEPVGATIGPYKLLEQIGTGGMGAVYVAEQKEPVRRTVALKVIKPGMDTREVIARFEAERQALAMMNHPHIAKVLDAGSTVAGRPYFVMELVKGLPITDFCDGRKLDTRERLQLFITICQAVQHAHQKGLIHRDLKPSNVLVEMHDVTPVPKVIDFGVAKAIGQQLTEKTLHTGFYQMLGTPMYMSPEQAGQSSLDVDTRSDVYSLGVLLYELLTGTTPFDKETFSKVGLDEMRRIIREDEPPRPSQRVSTLAAEKLSTISQTRGLEPRRLSASLSGELDWIVMKALEKDRNRRYETASELAQDVERYLDGEPVRACPPSAWYRLRKFARRNRITFVTSAIVAAALLMGTVVSTAQAIRATRAEQESETRLGAEQKAREAAEEAKTLAQQNAAIAQQNAAVAYRQQYKAEMHAGLGDWHAGNVSRLYQTAVEHLAEPGRADLRGWEWYYLLSLCQEGRILCEHRDVVSSVAWSPDGRHLASTSYDGDAIVWDARSGTLARRFSMSKMLTRGVDWSPDGRQLAWGSVADDNAARIWDRDSDEVHVLRGHNFSLTTCNWSPDGRRLATTAMDRTARIWDTETCRCLHVLDGHLGRVVHAACWTRDGKSLVTVAQQDENAVKVWDTETGKLLRELSPEPRVQAVSASSSGPEQLVLGTASGTCWLVNTQTWQTGPMIRAHAGEIHAVAFSPDGATFASGGTDGRVSLWDAGDGRLLYTLHGHQSGVTSLAWSPNGKQLASGSADRSVRLWDVPTPRKPIVLCGPPEAVHTLVWSNDDRVLTSINAKDGRTTSWDRLTNATVQAIPVGSGLWDAASPDGRFIAVPVLKDGFVVIRIHDILQQRDLGELTSELTKLKALVWSPDSSRLAAFDKRLQVWAIPQVRPLFNWQGVDINSLAWTADSSRLAVAGNGDPVENGYEKRMGFVHVFDMDGQTRVLKLRLGRERVSAECVAWHPDGILVASGNENGLVMVWDSTTGRLEVSSHLHIRRIRALDWTPDGRRIASVSEDGTLKIWDCRTGDELLSLTDSGDPLTAVKWSSDGKQLATGDEVGRVQIWDATVAYAVFSGAGQPRVRSRMYEERALRLIELTELPDAAVQLSEAINLSPGRASYRRLRGLIYLRLGRLEEALADLAVAVDLAPDDPAVLNSRVAIYAARGEWGEAIPDALRLVELQQSGFERHELALLYLLFGRHDRYREVCQQIFAVDHDELIPSTAEKGAWTCAIIPQSLPNLKNIVRQTREAYAWPGPVTQSSVDGKMSLGALLYRVGQTEEAIAELTKASRDWEFDVPVVNPFDALPAYGWYFLAMAHHDLGHYQQARKWFDKAEAYAKTALAKPAAIREIPLPGAIYWHQRVVLEHLQREARMVLNVAGFKANPGGK